MSYLKYTVSWIVSLSNKCFNKFVKNAKIFNAKRFILHNISKTITLTPIKLHPKKTPST